MQSLQWMAVAVLVGGRLSGNPEPFEQLKNSWIIALAAVAAWVVWRKKATVKEPEASPVRIDSLSSSVGQGLQANEEVGLFDRLFGIRSAPGELAKLKTDLTNYRVRICHSDGTCEVQSRTVLGSEGLSPLRAPKYLLDYLGVGT